MSTAAVGIVTTMLALRDRARFGGSYHGTAALTAYNAISLLPEIGLYPPSVVKRLQETYEWAPMTPDLHAAELLTVVLNAWEKKTRLLEREGFFVEFEDTPLGERVQILAPVVRYKEEAVRLRWMRGPRPYRSDGEVRFGGGE